MLDEQMIQLFFKRSEQAIVELDKQYGKICRSLSYQILKSKEDAEECVNDAYLGMWNQIPPTKPNPLLTFLCKIVRNISIARYYANNAQKRNSMYDVALEEVRDFIASPNTVEQEIEMKELVRLIEQFLDTLSATNRIIFMRRFWFFDSYGEIANQMKLTEKNVSVRLTRTKKQLRNYLEKRGIVI